MPLREIRVQRQVGGADDLGVAPDRARNDVRAHDALPAVVHQGRAYRVDQGLEQGAGHRAVDDERIQGKRQAEVLIEKAIAAPASSIQRRVTGTQGAASRRGSLAARHSSAPPEHVFQRRERCRREHFLRLGLQPFAHVSAGPGVGMKSGVNTGWCVLQAGPNPCEWRRNALCATATTAI